MRTLAFGLVMMALPATLLGCAVDTSADVSENDRGEVERGTATSSGASSPPVQNDPAQSDSAPKVQNLKTVNGPGGGPGPVFEPDPIPWKGDHHPGSGGGASSTQKKDEPLHTKIRDMIQPLGDGKDP